MKSLLTQWIFGVGSAFLCSLCATEVIKRIALQYDFVCRPSGKRWNERTVALGGGIATHFAITLGLLIWVPQLAPDLLPALFICFTLGILDDVKGVMPIQKLTLQLAAAVWLVFRGYVLPIPIPIFAECVTCLWIVGLTNALNMIDNMDGIAIGVALFTALGLFILFQGVLGNPELAIFSLVVAGSCAGFLMHNFSPASIFMGDVGSLPLGCLLAALSTRIHRNTHEILSLIPIGLVMIYPLFDLILVVVERTRAERKVYVGGKDHSSHRLVMAGASETTVSLIIYCIVIAGVLISYFALTASAPGVVVGIACSTLLMAVLAGVFLCTDIWKRTVERMNQVFSGSSRMFPATPETSK